MTKIKVNDNFPESDVFRLIDGEPIKIKISDLLSKKKIILFGLPGAFSSVCSAKHLPSYIKNFEKFKSLGVDKLMCVSVNDPFVMEAWGKANNVGDKIIMIADPFLELTKKLGTEIDKSNRGLGMRSNRFAMIIDDMTVKAFKEEKDTKYCEVSAAESVIEHLT